MIKSDIAKRLRKSTGRFFVIERKPISKIVCWFVEKIHFYTSLFKESISHRKWRRIE